MRRGESLSVQLVRRNPCVSNHGCAGAVLGCARVVTDSGEAQGISPGRDIAGGTVARTQGLWGGWGATPPRVPAGVGDAPRYKQWASPPLWPELTLSLEPTVSAP